MRHEFFYKINIFRKAEFEMNKKEDVICPICGENMEEYNYDYNSDRNEKIDYKCPNCGHRLCKIL